MSRDQNMQLLKGFRDFVGPDARKRNWLISIIRTVFERYGFEPLETPALEYEALLMGKYGAEAEKLIYRFVDNGGRHVAMRYDQTVPMARVIAEHQNEIAFPYKRYQIQPVWRADKPQKGRYREFYQSDIDIIGSSSPVADAEILVTFFSVFKEMGISSIQIKINDRKQLIQVIKDYGVEDSNVLSVIQTIDKIEKESKEDLVEELTKKNVQNGMELLDNLLQSQPSEDLKTIMQYAISLGVPESTLVFSPALARGLDYYTGMIFEGSIPEYTVGSIGGGGRYDNLINDLVGIDKPAVGVALGFDRILEAADELGIIPTDISSATVLVTIFNEDLINNSLEITSLLRSKAISTECYSDASAKIDKQLKYADRKGIPYVIILGPEEVEKNSVVLKNMKEGTQETISIDQLVSHIS
jgi:histidyl-tRNA synthetase